MRTILVGLVTVLPLACAAKTAPCPSTAAPAPIAAAEPHPARLRPVIAGTRTEAMAKLVPTILARKQQFVGCDLHYDYALPGSSIFLRWYVYESAEEFEQHKDVQHTDGKSQKVKGNGVINAYLQALDGTFQPGIYVCEFELMHENQPTGQIQRGAIWLDPPASPNNKL